MRQNQNKTEIVVLGGGFGGVYAYLELNSKFRRDETVAITLVSKTDQFLFVPMIHEVATGSLLPSSITQSLRILPHGFDSHFIEAEVKSVDLDKQTVLLENLHVGGEETIRFDYLVMALGSKTNFFGVKGAQEFALTLKDLQDAKKIKNKMIEAFEVAAWIGNSEEQKRLLHFVVVGGGATGVELAGEMADFLRHELDQAFPTLRQSAKVTLIHSGDRLLNQSDEWMSKGAEKILKKMKVELRFNERVTEVRDRGVLLGDEFLLAGNVIWTAGVKAMQIDVGSKKNIQYEERTGRVKVNNYLQIESYPNVFVAGDMAWIHDKEKMQPYPMRAQFATREGQVAGENIYRLERGRSLREFEWEDKGFIVSLGKMHALAEVYHLRFSGFAAWVLYRGAYLFKLVGLKAKIRTFVEWGMNLFLPRDISKF